jgi:uncharacterized protein (UPF0548 family)
MGRTSDRDLLQRASALPLSYPEEGATAWAGLPAGYHWTERTLTLGSGDDVYQRACTGLLSWQMHRRAGIAITATAATAIPGTCALLVIGRRPLAITAACRVVYDVAAERQRGFAYGTLPGHPVRGEESFIVTHHDDDRVTFTIRAFSLPATLVARTGGPLTSLTQNLMTSRYLRSLRSIASASKV